ncbi:MAG TPA: histidine kinase dimerization/phospho-acceptor domain-containing protein [Candidatus Limnocylindrales bacterium]|jgi:hypothetical protein|nr:histidine kinase dimerization/phospho-acceptor domain-containing protein [Candidatus Limnocylindrales bacterium]
MNAFRSADCGEKVGTNPVAAIDCNVDLCGRTRAGIPEDGCNDCGAILHGLNNALAAMLLNAQVLEWKLPSYSRSRRYLHEIERNAQRGGALVKQLLGRMEARCEIGLSGCRIDGEGLTLAGDDGVASARELATVGQVEEPPLGQTARPAGVLLAHRKKVPHTMV